MSDTVNPTGDARLTVIRDSSTPAPPELPNEEYKRFEALARRIVAVPKTELDQQRKAT